MPNRMQINYDVNKAMFHVLVPTLIPEDEYNVTLKPSNWNIGPEPWANQFRAILSMLSKKYDQLPAENLRAKAVDTYDRSLADTRDSIVDEILVANLWFPTG
ncbi:MAG: hypothetical protein R3D05_08120 [Dongiaceae bacterium]